LFNEQHITKLPRKLALERAALCFMLHAHTYTIAIVKHGGAVILYIDGSGIASTSRKRCVILICTPFVMNYKQLLIGKWQPVKDCDYINGHWQFYHRYQKGKDYYIFDGEHFTTHGAGYYEDGIVFHYAYDPKTQLIHLPKENIHVIRITSTRLVLEINIFPDSNDESMRIVLERYPEEP